MIYLCSEKSVRTKMLIMCAVHIRVKNACKLISVKTNIDIAFSEKSLRKKICYKRLYVGLTDEEADEDNSVINFLRFQSKTTFFYISPI